MPKHKRPFVIFWLALSGIGAIQQLPAQTEVTIPASKDNTLYENPTGTLSNGAGAFLFAGRTNSGQTHRALLAFDVAGHVPAGAAIQSVRLTLNMSKTISGAQSIALHRVLADWGEGSSNATGEEGAGATATAGDATWLHTFFGTQLWENPGGDFSPTASATLSVNANGSYTWGSSTDMVSEVQAWLDAPASNFGWVLISAGGTGSAKRFDSRQNPNATSRPSLAVVYTTSTAVDNERNRMPAEFAIAQNYPNPFNPETTIRYDLPRASHVRLTVYDVLGNQIRVLVDNLENAGIKYLTWDGSDDRGRQVSSGFYFYRLEAGTFSQVRRLTLMK